MIPGSSNGVDTVLESPTVLRFTLPPNVDDLPDYQAMAAAAIKNPTTRVYVDTSWLMWLLQIGRAARREFLEVWTKDGITSQVFVPVWAVHELYYHLQKRTVWQQTQQSTTLYVATLKAIAEHADIVADDSLCRASRFVSKADLIENLRHSATAVNECVSALQMGDDLYAEAVADLTQFVNQHSLSSNIFDILKADQASVETRFEGRLPPGYKDGPKLENSFGDLVFWTEILRDAPNGSTVIVLTRDEKTDWRHLPFNIVVYDKRVIRNNAVPGAEVQLPHPSLRFEANLSGIHHLHVMNPTIFALSLSMHFTHASPNLLQSAYPRPLIGTESPNYKGFGLTVPPASPPQSIAPPTITRQVPLTGPEEVEFSELLAGFPRESLTLYRQELSEMYPPTSDPGVSRLLTTTGLLKLDTYQLVELGHSAICRAGSGQTGVALSDLLAVARSDSAEAESAIMLGYLCGVYLDGQLGLRLRVLGEEASAILNIATEPRFAQTRSKIRDFVAGLSGTFLVNPTDWPDPIQIDVKLTSIPSSKRKRLDVLAVGEQSLLDPIADDTLRFSTLFPEPAGTLLDVVKLIATTYAIPLTLLKFNYTEKTLLTWDTSVGLSALYLSSGGVLTTMQASFGNVSSEVS